MSPNLARRFAPMALHIGEQITARMKEVGMAKTTLAERIGKDRGTLDRWLEGYSIDVMHLRKISLVLERNFLRLLADDLDTEMPALRVVREPEPPAYAQNERKLTPVRIEMDLLDADQQAMVLDFADKLRRVQERNRK